MMRQEQTEGTTMSQIPSKPRAWKALMEPSVDPAPNHEETNAMATGQAGNVRPAKKKSVRLRTCRENTRDTTRTSPKYKNRTRTETETGIVIALRYNGSDGD